MDGVSAPKKEFDEESIWVLVGVPARLTQSTGIPSRSMITALVVTPRGEKGRQYDTLSNSSDAEGERGFAHLKGLCVRST